MLYGICHTTPITKSVDTVFFSCYTELALLVSPLSIYYSTKLIQLNVTAFSEGWKKFGSRNLKKTRLTNEQFSCDSSAFVWPREGVQT